MLAQFHGKSIWYYLMEKSIWHYLMENLFGIISWEIYLVLSHGKYIWHYLIVGSTSAVYHRMKWEFPDESSDCHVISDELVFEVKFVSKVCQ